jgi:hypothetical protein
MLLYLFTSLKSESSPESQIRTVFMIVDHFDSSLQRQAETILHSALRIDIKSWSGSKLNRWIIRDRIATEWEWPRAEILGFTISIHAYVKVRYFHFQKRHWHLITHRWYSRFWFNLCIKAIIRSSVSNNNVGRKSELGNPDHIWLITAVLVDLTIHFQIHTFWQSGCVKNVMDFDCLITLLIGIF